MPEHLSPLTATAIGIETFLLLFGLVLWWPLIFSPAAIRRNTAPAPLPPWEIELLPLVIAALAIILASGVIQSATWALAEHLYPKISDDGALLVQGAAFQGGLLLSGLTAAFALGRISPRPPPPTAPRPPTVLSAVLTFVASLPLLLAVSILWRALLDACGYNSPPQEIVELFARTGSRAEALLTAFLAVVVAPVTEELLFRAGLFRYLRARIPRPVAYIVPAAIFAALHNNLGVFAPLFVLGLVFSFAYERTGNIAVTMIAHALFNLNTLLLLVSGVPFN